jgi:hypothetical protein
MMSTLFEASTSPGAYRSDVLKTSHSVFVRMLGVTACSKTYAPWELESSVAFKGRAAAANFEHDLTSGSGNAFLTKRLLPRPSVASEPPAPSRH